jgi:hypothetical protein
MVEGDVSVGHIGTISSEGLGLLGIGPLREREGSVK